MLNKCIVFLVNSDVLCGFLVFLISKVLSLRLKTGNK